MYSVLAVPKMLAGSTRMPNQSKDSCFQIPTRSRIKLMSSKSKEQKQSKSKKPHFWRPLMSRPWQERQADGGIVRLIGLELRMRDPMGQQEEVQMIPLNIEVPNAGNAAYQWQFGPHTLHTSVGDINIQAVQLIPSGL